MLKKVWFMLVVWSFLMVSGCSGKPIVDAECKVVSETEISEMEVTEDLEADVSSGTDTDVIGNIDTSVEAGQTQTSDVDEQCLDVSNSGASTTEELAADDTTKEADVESPVTEAPSEPETVTNQPTSPPAKAQSTTPEHTTPTSSMEVPATKDSAPPITDDRGNPADGSPILEITFNIPQAEYVGYDADRVARLAVEKCKAAGMIPLPENLDNLLAEGKITQEEYNEYYPYDGCGYYSVFVETNLNIASTISGERLCSEEAIADYIAGMMVLEVEPCFYIECAGVYQGNSVEFYEFRCYR
ncbi:MAG: hypothetical protein ACI39R_01375 [Lachnospiraceae bacterium]